MVKILQRLTDKTYLQHALWYYPNRVFMKRSLNALRQYHSGKTVDFSKTRDSRRRSIVRYANRHCPYYRDLFQTAKIDVNRNADQFERIPLLDKSIIRKNSDRIISSQLPKMIHGIRNTGGSTGEPLSFYSSIDFDSEHQAFLYRQIGYQKGDRILAMDGSLIRDNLISRNIYWDKKSEKDIPYGSMTLSSLYLNDTSMQYYVDFINTFKPDIIRGYPSFVSDVASYISKKGIKIDHSLKGVVLTSEGADKNQIRRAVEAFSTKVYLQYGHAEAALFGYTLDESYEYFCSPFYGYVEVLDSKGKHVGPGEIGEVVCTGFYNYAMPFIRYRTGDLAVFLEDRDGIVHLQSVLGRTQDYIYDANMKKTLLTALVFGLHYKAFAHIRKWQVHQSKPGEIEIHIIKDESYCTEDEEEIRSNFMNIAHVETILRVSDF